MKFGLISSSPAFVGDRQVVPSPITVMAIIAITFEAADNGADSTGGECYAKKESFVPMHGKFGSLADG